MTYCDLKTKKRISLGYIFYYTLFLIVIQLPIFHNLTADISRRDYYLFEIFGKGELQNLEIKSDQHIDQVHIGICLVCDLLTTVFEDNSAVCNGCILDHQDLLFKPGQLIHSESFYLLPFLRGPPLI